MATSFSLSLELVLLMSWLLKHKKSDLKKLIAKSLDQGLQQELDLIETFTQEELLNVDSDFAEELHNSILEFLMHLEDTLLKELSKTTNSYKQEISPMAQKLNTQKIDSRTVLLSLQNVNQLIEDKNLLKKNKNNTEVTDILFSEILKNWVPKTNEPIN
ncbi:MAG: hypothetical protein SZ59_C0005G0004 [candidate division TM6 bacterium GW2011_GWF2_28_16]|jgi:hypothetical protein|nr:MAG: hypothetical protein SZ59_C0005G0004 [candidate division TM6 bacterium GW2011_GWF2_28_16]